MKIRRIALLALVFVLLSANIPLVSYGAELGLVVNNKEFQLTKPMLSVEGITYIYYKDMAKALGFQVSDTSNEKMNGKINFGNDDVIVVMGIDDYRIAIVKRSGSQTQKEISYAPKILNGSIYIPIRVFAENTGAIVGWDGDNNNVVLIYDTDLRYAEAKTVSTFIGKEGYRNRLDGVLNESSFISPEAMAIAQDGTLYVADSGVLRVVSGNNVSTISIEPSYISPKLMACKGNDLYFVTNEFYDSKTGMQCVAVMKYSNGSCISLTPRPVQTGYTEIRDISVGKDGNVYLLINNNSVGQEYIAVIDEQDRKFKFIKNVEPELNAMCAGENGEIYLSSSASGCIYKYIISTDTLFTFSGIKGDTAFVDGPNARYFEPKKIEYSNGALYVLDRNVLRRISIDAGGYALTTETIAGKVTANTSAETINGKASEAEFINSYVMDIEVTGYGILISDPKKAVIRIVN